MAISLAAAVADFASVHGANGRKCSSTDFVEGECASTLVGSSDDESHFLVSDNEAPALLSSGGVPAYAWKVSSGLDFSGPVKSSFKFGPDDSGDDALSNPEEESYATPWFPPTSELQKPGMVPIPRVSQLSSASSLGGEWPTSGLATDSSRLVVNVGSLRRTFTINGNGGGVPTMTQAPSLPGLGPMYPSTAPEGVSPTTSIALPLGSLPREPLETSHSMLPFRFACGPSAFGAPTFSLLPAPAQLSTSPSIPWTPPMTAEVLPPQMPVAEELPKNDDTSMDLPDTISWNKPRLEIDGPEVVCGLMRQNELDHSTTGANNTSMETFVSYKNSWRLVTAPDTHILRAVGGEMSMVPGPQAAFGGVCPPNLPTYPLSISYTIPENEEITIREITMKEALPFQCSAENVWCIIARNAQRVCSEITEVSNKTYNDVKVAARRSLDMLALAIVDCYSPCKNTISSSEEEVVPVVPATHPGSIETALTLD
eukprot:GHVT01004202.1.p1 GENE.GHVT01004202.1~~GHVT01004202.1.p1  ORF type:complete len:484 (-),score=38.62 GHVT01004202.1:223-1674(-)